MSITAIITHYNIPKNLLDRCIDSVNRFNLDYIIVDDCSKKEYKENLRKYDNVLYLKENLGVAQATIEALKNVKSDYIYRIDADDYILGVPDISSNEDAYINRFNGKISLNFNEFIKRPYAGLNGSVIKTHIAKKIWDVNIRYYEDIIIFSRLINNYKCVFNEIELYFYDSGREGSITSMKDRLKHINYAKNIAKKEYREN